MSSCRSCHIICTYLGHLNDTVLHNITVVHMVLCTDSIYIPMVLFRQLLHDCGVGLEGEEDGEVAAVGQHRILIFCQFKGILDIIESDLFK